MGGWKSESLVGVLRVIHEVSEQTGATHGQPPNLFTGKAGTPRVMSCIVLINGELKIKDGGRTVGEEKLRR